MRRNSKCKVDNKKSKMEHMYSPKCFTLCLSLSLSFSLIVWGGLGTVLGLGLNSRSSLSAAMEDDEDALKIVFNGPARNWTDALPIGNGRLGAMVWGGVSSDLLNLNEDTLWSGIPGNYTDPNALKALAKVRKLVNDANYSEATSFADKDLSGTPSDVYQLLGDLRLDFDETHLNYTPKTYHRELNLDTATVTVRYTVGDVEFTREYFASNPDQVIVIKISANKPNSVSFNVSLNSQLQYKSSINGKNQIIMEGGCPGRRNQGNDDHKGIQFSAVVDIQVVGKNGAVNNLDGHSKLKVENADWAVIFLVASSSFGGPFKNPSETGKNSTAEALSHMKTVVVNNESYSSIWTRHLDDYWKLFRRVSLKLSKEKDLVNSLKPTSERVRSFDTDEDPRMVELLFQYGRYLLISSSRAGSQAANLQGIWNKDMTPPWDSAPHLNINLEMNYWGALPTNLDECHEPLLDFISSLAVNGMKTAKVNYGANGWVVHQVSDIWAKTSPDAGQGVWALWPMGGAWLSTHLWEHYTYTMDKSFLKNKAYPLLHGATLFLLDWLIEGKDGFLQTNPSTSPEHMFISPDGKPASVSFSSTMDIAITKQVFAAIVSAAEILGVNIEDDDHLIQQVLKAQARLPPYRVTKDGAIMEWVQDFQDPEPYHRHVSHLYGVFPGHTITPQDNPTLCKAANYSLYQRGKDGPGWSTVWKAALWARLQNGQHAYQMLKHLFNLVDPNHEQDFEGGLYSNLFSAHPPFQIDANFGFSAAVAEMLVQSTVQDLYLLPALPQDKWSDGCVKGLKARGGVTVDICWSGGDLQEFSLSSISSLNLVKSVHYRGTMAIAKISFGKVYTFNKQLKCTNTYSLPH